MTNASPERAAPRQTTLAIQAKLTIGPTDDPLEREADDIADRVMRMPGPAPSLLRRCPGGCPQDESGRDSIMQGGPGSHPGDEVFTQGAVHSHRGTGAPLPGSVRNFFEPRFGTPLDDVRVHAGADAGRLAAGISTRAFTVGRDIFFGHGEYRPGSLHGRRLLAHELVHALQQTRGVVRRAPGDPEETPGTVISAHETNKSLGEELIRRVDAAHANIDFVLSVLHELWPWDRDDVAYYFVEPLSEADLARLSASGNGRALLTELREAMSGFVQVQAETEQIARIDRVLVSAGPTDSTGLVAFLQELMADGQLGPADWSEIRTFATTQGIELSPLVTAFNETGFDFPAAVPLAMLALGDNPAMAALAATYDVPVTDKEQTASIIASSIIVEFFTDMMLTRDEFDALQALLPDMGDVLKEEITNELDEKTHGPLTNLLRNEDQIFDPVLASDSLFPLRFAPGDEGIRAETDLGLSMVSSLLERGEWNLDAIKVVFDITRGVGSTEAAGLLETAGIEKDHAVFLSTRLSPKVGGRDIAGFLITFEKGATGWRLTGESLFNLSLPEHASDRAAISPREGIEAVGGPAELRQGLLLSWTSEGEYREDAYVVAVSTTGANLDVVIPVPIGATEQARKTYVDNAKDALRYVAPGHAALLEKVVYYPRPDPDGIGGAEASPAASEIRVYDGQVMTVGTFVHELGHLVSFDASRKDAGFWRKWRTAMEQDAVAISRYGMTSDREDFAEAYYLYNAAGPKDRATRDRYRHRYGILDTLF